MGGGGGSGEQKDDRGSGGGAGGGAVLVRAKTVAGTGIIGANGKNADNVTTLSLLGDGAGGGGAGGTVLLRIVDSLDCNGIEAKGGRGGSTELAGTNLFGPGGGGGGGRILVQTKARGTSCTPDASAGIAGTAGDGTSRQATAGAIGEAGDDTAPRTDPNYCFSNTGALQCANPRPVCNEQTGYCARCNGGNGDPTDFACPDPARPVCLTANGTCEGCNGDLGSGTSTACQLSSAPYCFGSTQANPGSCGRCTGDPDCAVGTHPGPKCETVSGTCGKACSGDGDCKSTEWCAQNVCIPKTANRQPVTNVPPFAGECTREAGQRTCVAGVCEETDDRCGFKNGTPCTGSPQCRSDVCFDRDDLCGKPSGEPCERSSECRSEACENGTCAGCQEDADCPLRQVCDTSIPSGRCVPGCRGASRCAAGEVCSARDGGIGACEPGPPDGGTVVDSSGIVEGGGCSCETTPATSPFTIAGISFVVLALVRRRRGGMR
jgi:hypothetical protein